MAYRKTQMEFIEAPAFNRHWSEYLGDEDYRALQAELVTNPELGDLMQNTGGFRKLRWVIRGAARDAGAVFESSTTILHLTIRSG